MTLMSSKYFCQKNCFEAIFFRISDCAKIVMGYTVSAIIESRKLKNRDEVDDELFLDSVILVI
jgi:hypothetical protein